MTTFVIDAAAAIDLAPGGATIPPQHSLAAPTLLRRQTLALVHERCTAARSTNRAVGTFSTTVGCGSGSSATEHCRTTHGGQPPN